MSYSWEDEDSYSQNGRNSSSTSNSDNDNDNDNDKHNHINEVIIPDEPLVANNNHERKVRSQRSNMAEIVNNLGNANVADLHPALVRRVRDFKFAQQKRQEKYGEERPWGILGLYEHLASIRIDLEWAEDATWRRHHDEPYLSWSDFEKARAKGKNRPFFTYFVLTFCTVMLITSIGVNNWKIEPLSANPMIGPSAETLLKLGAKQSSLIVNRGEWYRLFSPMVLHAGFIHYLLNMLALWFVGSAVEQSHGIVNTAIAFIMSAVGGTILSAIFLPQYISVGASGGIFGFIGMCISDIVVNWNLLFFKHDDDNGKSTAFRHAMVLLWLILDVVINCIIGLTPFVDNFTHLGGLIYGFLCGISTVERLEISFFGVASGTCAKIRNNLVQFGGLIASVMLIMVTTILLVQSDGISSPCDACRYISCVPFPPWSHEKWWYCDDCQFVTADASKPTKNSLYFEVLDLTCPDGAVEIINITDNKIADRNVIRGRLPQFCRENCEDVLYKHTRF